MKGRPYIAIEGVIGVGKTTLARLLQPALNAELTLEVFEENPFLSDFYDDRARYAFQTQIFFLLSRYRQQTLLASMLRKSPVIADYTFEKDRLFARLNLSGDELTMYERVYTALGEKVRQPDLLVYLRAELDVLMGRIAMRDRPYERNMDPGYIQSLRQAYEDMLASYSGPVLVIDTNELNIVQHQADRDLMIERIRSALQMGTYQSSLPGVDLGSVRQPEQVLRDVEVGSRRLSDFQEFHLSLDAEKGFDTDPYLNFIGLNEEVGELAHALKRMWIRQSRLGASGKSPEQARDIAISDYREDIQDELADCLAYLLKLSNYAGIDLEQAYLNKMDRNTQRRWEDGQIVEDAQ